MKLAYMIALTALVISIVECSQAQAQPAYSFKKIADGSYQPHLSINDAGVVGFGGSFGVFSGNGGPVSTIADTSGQFSSVVFSDINDNGVIAFTGRLDAGGGGVFTSDGTTVTTIALAGTPEIADVENKQLSINSSGAVAFFARPSSGGDGIYVGSGGPLTTIAHSDGPLTFTSNDMLSMNDSGSVAFNAHYDPSGTRGIFVGNGGPTTTVTDLSGPFDSFGDPSINSVGTIAFKASLDFPAGDGIFAWTNGAITTIADTNGPFGFLGAVSLAPNGKVAFSAILDGAVTIAGIFAGPDPVAHKVIKPGDPLFGSSFTQSFFNPVTNARGDVAFHYRLANGVRGIAVASLVPEPASVQWLLASLSLISLKRGLSTRLIGSRFR